MYQHKFSYLSKVRILMVNFLRYYSEAEAMKPIHATVISLVKAAIWHDIAECDGLYRERNRFVSRN